MAYNVHNIIKISFLEEDDNFGMTYSREKNESDIIYLIEI
jgi:hypothetical protein